MNRKIYKIYYMSFIGQEIGSEAASLTGGYIGNKFKKKQFNKLVYYQVKFKGSSIPFQNGGKVKPPNG